MAVPAIALYASSPSSSYPSYDFDVNGSRSCSHGSSSSSSQKATTGGLSYLFNSTPIKTGVFSSSLLTAGGGEELGTSWKSEKSEELSLSSSYGYSHFNSLFKRDHHSPVSVFQCPISCTSSASSGGGSIRGSPSRSFKERSNGDTSKRLFSGFVRNALGSCLDAEVDMGASPSIALDELTFNMEDGFVETGSGSYAKDLLQGAQMRHKIFCDEFVVKAFNEAEKAHRGQMRASGDPYLQHCVETAVLLALVGANSTVVAAGLLHDTMDDSFIDYDYILRTFGSGVADLVDGVSKLSQLSKLARENNTASRIAEADHLHTMFLAMADARAVLIKLADRLHNMMTLDSLPPFKQQRFAKETLEIFAPLANRLGIYSWKEQLENLCFKHLNVEQYEDLSSKLLKSFDEAMVSSSIEKLEQALRKGGVSYHALFGRHKSLYSIYHKMLKKKLNMNEIHDIHGLRLILENEDDCYKALQVVHQIWPEVPGRFKDYISHPKVNGYQSLHTVVMGEGGLPVEVQIRTKEMHLQAEIGFAAHWRYKEGDCKYASSLLQRIEWARWVLSWQCEAMNMDKSCFNYTDSIKPSCAFPSHSEDCPFSDRPVCSQDGPVFVIAMENDKMSVQEFSSNSTVMDLLERAGRGSSKWTPYRFPLKEELRPRLNREPVNDPTCKLKMGDVVELTPSISDKSLTKYREEIQRLFNQGLDISATGPAPSMVGWGS